MSQIISSIETLKVVVQKVLEVYSNEEFYYYNKLWYIEGKLVCKAVYEDALNFISCYYLDKSYIEKCIKKGEEIVFHYTYSNPEKDRFITPISINDNILLGLERGGKYKKFKLDGVLIRSEFEDEYNLYKSKFDY